MREGFILCLAKKANLKKSRSKSEDRESQPFFMNDSPVSQSFFSYQLSLHLQWAMFFFVFIEASPFFLLTDEMGKALTNELSALGTILLSKGCCLCSGLDSPSSWLSAYQRSAGKGHLRPWWPLTIQKPNIKARKKRYLPLYVRTLDDYTRGWLTSTIWLTFYDKSLKILSPNLFTLASCPGMYAQLVHLVPRGMKKDHPILYVRSLFSFFLL